MVDPFLIWERLEQGLRLCRLHLYFREIVYPDQTKRPQTSCENEELRSIVIKYIVEYFEQQHCTVRVLRI